MWKVLIVEDEPIVRRTIINKLNWNSLGFQIVGEAGDGQEALKLIYDKHPDLVISDIVMPLMDGIELLKHVKRAKLPCLFLMLTCMNEFEYARQALEYGASNYILKLSMDVKSLEEALVKMKAELAESTEAMNRQKRMEYEHRYQELWSNYYDRDYALLESDIVYKMLPFIAPYVFVCAVYHGADEFTTEQLMQFIKLEPSVRLTIHFLNCQGITTFFGWSDSYSNLSTFNELKFPYTAVYTKLHDASDLPVIWSTVLRKLDEQWYQGCQKAVYCDIITEHETKVLPLSWDKEKELLQGFEDSKLDACLSILNEMWAEMEDKRYPITLVKNTVNRLDRTFARIVNHPGISRDEMNDAYSHQQLKIDLMNRIEQYLNYQIRESQALTDHDEINKIIMYIHKNYDKPITLKMMAEYVAMDEHYICGLYKKKVGENLINYIQKYRINKAKELLVESDLSVSDIAQRVGFSNDNYFNKIFKRMMLVTPSAYRMLHSK